VSNGQGARVYLPEGAGEDLARAVSAFLVDLDEIRPFRRRSDGTARRDWLADDGRDRSAQALARSRASALRLESDARACAETAQATLDAVDARIKYERTARDLALWVMLAEHEAAVTRTGTYSGDGWTPTDACRLVCVSRSLWENSVRTRRPRPWPTLSQAEAEESGAAAGRHVRDLGILRSTVRPVRDEAVRTLSPTMKNVEIAGILGITAERVAQIKTGSG
jgi:hypothetical protein